MKVHVFKDDIASATLRQCLTADRIADFILAVQKFDQPLRRTTGTLQLAPNFA